MCCKGYCSKCCGIKTAIVGALVLLNAYVWPRWWGVDGWVTFFGLLALIGGIVRAFKPTCGCPEACEMPAMPAKKKR